MVSLLAIGRACFTFLIDTRAGRTILLALVLVLGLAAWRWSAIEYHRGYAASEARYAAEQAKAAQQATDWLQRAAARQQSAQQAQAQADAAFQHQQEAIHAHPGGDQPLPPYLSNVARKLFP